MGKTIIPIGRSLGPQFDASGDLKHVEVDLGGDVKELTVDEALVWACATDNSKAHFDLKFDRDSYNAAIEERNDTMFDDDRDRLISRLFDLRLLDEVDLASGPKEDFLSKYRLIPTGHGLGNSQENPHKYGIGRLDQAEVHIGLRGYLLWLFGYREGSVWAACQEMARLDNEVTVVEAARAISTILPAIVAIDCGYLERI